MSSLKQLCMKQLLSIKNTLLEDELMDEIVESIENEIRIEYEIKLKKIEDDLRLSYNTKIQEIPHITYCLLNGNINDENLYDIDAMNISKKIVDELNSYNN